MGKKVSPGRRKVEGKRGEMVGGLQKGEEWKVEKDGEWVWGSSGEWRRIMEGGRRDGEGGISGGGREVEEGERGGTGGRGVRKSSQRGKKGAGCTGKGKKGGGVHAE